MVFFLTISERKSPPSVRPPYIPPPLPLRLLILILLATSISPTVLLLPYLLSYYADPSIFLCLPARTLMGEHAYNHSSMSPSTPAVQQHRGSSRHHATAPSSKTITTTRPAIKIIHIIAPEIIKTDAANFRELVQRLTGRRSNDLA